MPASFPPPAPLPAPAGLPLGRRLGLVAGRRLLGALRLLRCSPILLRWLLGWLLGLLCRLLSLLGCNPSGVPAGHLPKHRGPTLPILLLPLLLLRLLRRRLRLRLSGRLLCALRRLGALRPLPQQLNRQRLWQLQRLKARLVGRGHGVWSL